MLVHNFAPVAEGVNGPIAYAHSLDGHSWTLSQEIPADCTLRSRVLRTSFGGGGGAPL